MNIEQRRSNFAQFSDALWLRLEHDGTSIDFDVEQDELIDFAEMLADMAYDALHKIAGCDTDAARDALVDALSSIWTLREATQ